MAGALKPEVVERLVPQDQTQTQAGPHLGAMSDAAVARFQWTC